MRTSARCLLVLLTLAPVMAASPQARPPAQHPTPATIEAELVRLLNQERTARGLPALRADTRLADAARRHARVMADHKAIGHEFAGEPDLDARVDAVGVRFSEVGENVAMTDAADPALSSHRRLMDSRGHRANILDKSFTAVGVGVAIAGGTVYIVEVFARTS